jgi:ubiquinone/menaquinone biosynthesis C-methylase UbiE
LAPVKPFFIAMFTQRFMRFFFDLLYHPLAFTYDLVAATVSFGQWKNWGQSIVPFIEGTRILELGQGPGHLQRFLLNRGLTLFAIDESAQMGRLAKQRIGTAQKLTRGLAQALPYPNDSFDTILSTFPSEYIFNPRTLAEAKRVLRNKGRLILLPAAWPKSVLLKWLFRITGESPSELNQELLSRFKNPLERAGFRTVMHSIEVKSSALLIIVATL